MRNEICPFLPNSLVNPNFQKSPNLSIITAWQPWVMVAKDFFPFATMTDGCKKVSFKEFLNKTLFFCEIFFEVVFKIPYSWENPMIIWLTVAKDIFSFATVTDGCEGANFMGFSQYIYENELTSENIYLPMIFAKKEPISFLIQSRFLFTLYHRYPTVWKWSRHRQIYDPKNTFKIYAHILLYHITTISLLSPMIFDKNCIGFQTIYSTELVNHLKSYTACSKK